MYIFHEVERKDSKVTIWIDSRLGTCCPVYPFSFDCESQEEAELWKRHLENIINKHDEYVASNPAMYLHPHQISAVKKKLKDWDGRNHCWK